MKNKLMLEIPSPNVTKIIPLDFEELSGIQPKDFDISQHKNGIYEFDLILPGSRLGKLNDIYSMIARAFLAYRDHIYDVDVTGFKKNDGTPSSVGSTRFCTMNYDFAEFLTNIMKYRSVLDIIKDENGSWWEMLNVSQYFRFMRYQTGGEHYPHLDSDFEYEYNGAVTKYTVVVYFTRCNTGEIAFVDGTGTEFEGKTCDWSRQAKDEEIYLKIKPDVLKIVAFPHTLCHTVLPFTDNCNVRMICRGDILYKKVK